MVLQMLAMSDRFDACICSKVGLRRGCNMRIPVTYKTSGALCYMEPLMSMRAHKAREDQNDIRKTIPHNARHLQDAPQ